MWYLRPICQQLVRFLWKISWPYPTIKFWHFSLCYWNFPNSFPFSAKFLYKLVKLSLLYNFQHEHWLHPTTDCYRPAKWLLKYLQIIVATFATLCSECNGRVFSGEIICSLIGSQIRASIQMYNTYVSAGTIFQLFVNLFCQPPLKAEDHECVGERLLGWGLSGRK